MIGARPFDAEVLSATTSATDAASTGLLQATGFTVVDERGDVLSEHEMNARAARVTDEVALLRRQLVDHGLVERSRSGTEYTLVEPVDNS